MIHKERFKDIMGSKDSVARSVNWTEEDRIPPMLKGEVFFELRDLDTGAYIYREKKNLVTLDAGIVFGELLSLMTSGGSSTRTLMLAVGTGATGNILSPDAPVNTQRKLNNEIARKAFSRVTFRDADGVAVAIPTRILDLTAVFGEAEAVGPLDEMGIVAAISANPLVTNPINNGPTGYDPEIDTSNLDLLLNYLPFGVISKPSRSVFGITWRLTLG